MVPFFLQSTIGDVFEQLGYILFGEPIIIGLFILVIVGIAGYLSRVPLAALFVVMTVTSWSIFSFYPDFWPVLAIFGGISTMIIGAAALKIWTSFG